MLNLSSVEADCFQENNEPGISPQVYCIIAKALASNWPTEANINDVGEILDLPTYKDPTTKWAVYDMPNNTAKLTIDGGADNGYQGGDKQTLALALAGLNKGVIAEQKKHINAGSIWIVPMKGGEYVVAGSSKNPIFTKWKWDSGVKMGDKRGFTVMGEGEVEWAIATLTAAQVALLPMMPLA